MDAVIWNGLRNLAKIAQKMTAASSQLARIEVVQIDQRYFAHQNTNASIFESRFPSKSETTATAPNPDVFLRTLRQHV